MAETEQGVACPACGQRHRWEPPLARQPVRCACGQTLRMPGEPDGLALLEPAPMPPDTAAPPPAPASAPQSVLEPAPTSAPRPAASRADGTYELAELPPEPPRPAPPVARPCPACGQKLAPGAVLCLNCGYHLESGQRLATAVVSPDAGAGAGDSTAVSAPPTPTSAAFGGPPPENPAAPPADPADLEPPGEPPADPFTDRTLPVILIAIGLVVTFVQSALLGTPSKALGIPAPSMFQGLYEVVVTTAITAALLLATAVGLARVADLSFGPLGPAVLKLLAIALAPLAIGTILTKLLGGGCGGWVIGLMAIPLLYWALTVRLFAFDRQRTFYTVLIVFAVSGVVALVRGVLGCAAAMLWG